MVRDAARVRETTLASRLRQGARLGVEATGLAVGVRRQRFELELSAAARRRAVAPLTIDALPRARERRRTVSLRAFFLSVASAWLGFLAAFGLLYHSPGNDLRFVLGVSSMVAAAALVGFAHRKLLGSLERCCVELGMRQAHARNRARDIVSNLWHMGTIDARPWSDEHAAARASGGSSLPPLGLG
jgi:hypothetical protein